MSRGRPVPQGLGDRFAATRYSAKPKPCFTVLALTGEYQAQGWDPVLEDGSCDHEWESGGEGAWPVCKHCGESAPDDYGQDDYQ